MPVSIRFLFMSLFYRTLVTRVVAQVDNKESNEPYAYYQIGFDSPQKGMVQLGMVSPSAE